MPPCKPSTKILPATFAWSVLITCSAIFYGCALPYLTTEHSSAITVYICLLTLYVVANFGLSTFLDPGAYPKARESELKAEDGRAAPLFKNVDIHGVTMRMKWCTTCMIYRPPRCSHCSQCNSCIETFDHHCPWVNNCIGRSNYRFFVQFLMSLVIYIITILAFSLLYILENSSPFTTVNNILLVIMMVVSGLLSIPISGLLGFHLVLIARGRTTNEQMTGKLKDGHNPYTRGCMKNFQFVLCGPSWPKLTGRELTAASFDADSIRLIYKPAAKDQRVYMEPRSNGSVNLTTASNGKKRYSNMAYSGTTDTSRISESLTPTKRSEDFDSSVRKLTSLNTSSCHSLVGMPELGAFGMRVPLSSMAATTTGPTVSQPLIGRLSSKQRSKSGDIRAPIATSEELSPMTPQSQNLSQSGDLMQLVPDAKFMANQSLGPSMSGLYAGPARKDNSFSIEAKAAIARGNVNPSTTDGIGDISFGSTTSAGRSRHPRNVTAAQSGPSQPNSLRDTNLSQAGRSAATANGDNSELVGLIQSAPGTVRRPASFARAVNSDVVSMSTDPSRRGASQMPGLETQHEESTSNILEISV